MEGIVIFLPDNFDKTRGSSGGGREGGGESLWLENDYPAAWAQAKKENKRILIDFTGQWCINCRTNERTVFKDPEVIDGFKKFVCVKLYTDQIPDPKLRYAQAVEKAIVQRGYQDGLGLELAQPTYAIIDPDVGQPFNETHTKLQARLIASRSGVVEKQDFLRFLRDDVGATRKVAMAEPGR
jgi:hypothetical protein